MEYTQLEQLRNRKAARREIEIEREIPRFKNKVHKSSKEYKREKFKRFNLVDSE